MKTNYGVRSTTPSNTKLKNGYTLYDWVKRQKCYPKFWGRNISGENAVTTEEIEYLKEKNCRLLAVLNELSEQTVSKTDGSAEAQSAVEAMKALGLPQNEGIAVLAEIKPEWSVSHNWMLSFAQTMTENGYVPGFIGNTDSSENFNFDRQCSHFVQAAEEMGRFGVVIMATEPKQELEPEEWKPYCPSAMEPEEIELWGSGKTVFDQIEVEDVYARDEEILEKMW